MKIAYKLWIVCVLMVSFASCRESKQTTAEKLVVEWIGKEIVFPPSSGCSYMGRDTVCPAPSNADYKVLVYTDSIGCTSCRLNLPVWKAYMEEMETLAPGKIDFLFHFQPKDRKELEYLLMREKLAQTVFIDEKGVINQLNNFPEGMEYQSFLLDRNNKVVSIGNPVSNPKMWEIYKQQITGTHE